MILIHWKAFWNFQNIQGPKFISISILQQHLIKKTQTIKQEKKILENEKKWNFPSYEKYDGRYPHRLPVEG